ncbi:unnamed protein product [Rotaria sordida]|uniref:Uncharacterized protein n=1 Tax=Rotaria sordida TaxID=392033 RepID=A0A815ECI6_9BILA|nr:unnamed protein product [Rotaria sordida]
MDQQLIHIEQQLSFLITEIQQELHDVQNNINLYPRGTAPRNLLDLQRYYEQLLVLATAVRNQILILM